MVSWNLESSPYLISLWDGACFYLSFKVTITNCHYTSNLTQIPLPAEESWTLGALSCLPREKCAFWDDMFHLKSGFCSFCTLLHNRGVFILIWNISLGRLGDAGKFPTLGFGSSHDLKPVRLRLMLCSMVSAESAWDSFPLLLPPPLLLHLPVLSLPTPSQII